MWTCQSDLETALRQNIDRSGSFARTSAGSSNLAMGNLRSDWEPTLAPRYLACIGVLPFCIGGRSTLDDPLLPFFDRRKGMTICRAG